MTDQLIYRREFSFPDLLSISKTSGVFAMFINVNLSTASP